MRTASKHISAPPVVDNDPFLHPGLVTSGRPSTASVPPDARNPRTPTLNLLLPHMRLDLQSKQCQKLHWKASHKAACPRKVAFNQRPGKPPEDKKWSIKMERWINAWIPTLSLCVPLALDLANNEDGYHDTHAYAPLFYSSSSHFLIQLRREVSSCPWNTLVWTETIDHMRLGN